MHCRRAQPTEAREVMRWIKERHYTKRTPPGYVAVLEFLEGSERIGAMMLGRPTARSLNPDRILELTRMFFVELRSEKHRNPRPINHAEVCSHVAPRDTAADRLQRSIARAQRDCLRG